MGFEKKFFGLFFFLLLIVAISFFAQGAMAQSETCSSQAGSEELSGGGKRVIFTGIDSSQANYCSSGDVACDFVSMECQKIEVRCGESDPWFSSSAECSSASFSSRCQYSAVCVPARDRSFNGLIVVRPIIPAQNELQGAIESLLRIKNSMLSLQRSSLEISKYYLSIGDDALSAKYRLIASLAGDAIEAVDLLVEKLKQNLTNPAISRSELRSNIAFIKGLVKRINSLARS